MQKQKKCLKFSPQKPYAVLGKNFIKVVIILAFTPFMFGFIISQRTLLVWQLIMEKNEIHYVAFADILTELFQKYSLNGLLSALCWFFLHILIGSHTTNRRNSKKSFKLIYCHDNENVENNFILLSTSQTVRLYFENVYFVLVCTWPMGRLLILEVRIRI